MKTQELLPAERRFVYIFVATCLLIPAYWGELFPFTSAPMFRDRFSGYTEVIVRLQMESACPKSLRLHWNLRWQPSWIWRQTNPLYRLYSPGDANWMTRSEAM